MWHFDMDVFIWGILYLQKSLQSYLVRCEFGRSSLKDQGGIQVTHQSSDQFTAVGWVM